MFRRLLLASLTLSAATSVVRAQLTARTMNFVNQCSSEVYVKANSGASNGHQTCAQGCPAGTTCAGNGLCYYNSPAPNTGSYWVGASGGTMQIVYPAIPNPDNTAWDGNYQFCHSDQNCGSYGGPYSQVEFYLSETVPTPDAYDITLIAGVSVPFSVTPNVVDSTNSQSGSPYVCGDPGSPSPSTPGLGPSSWSFSPPESWYQAVTPPDPTNPQACTSGCPSGQTCGTIYTVQTNDFQEVCGYLSGYWTAEQICALNSDVTTPYDCQAPVTNDYIQTTLDGLQSCTGGSGTCYPNPPATADGACCGCADWNSIFGNGLVPPSTTQCGGHSAAWDSDVLPTIQWLKQISTAIPRSLPRKIDSRCLYACPNCYFYQYDDPSSSFTCLKDYNGYNTQNYTITFCPDGVSLGSGGGSSPPTSTASSSTTTTTPTPAPTTTTTTAAGPAPTSGSGTCNGAGYDHSQYVCDSGHICAAGEYYCAGSCYNPADYCCSGGALTQKSAGCTCGSAGFDGGSYVCDSGQLCNIGMYNCGGSCYSPSSYGCCNGGLTAPSNNC